MVKVSIIMPSLNVEKYIRKSLESAINQTLHEIEIICVDAGSTDGTVEIIKEFETKDDRVHLINSSIKSYGYQMNLGISKAHGQYIGIIETDDFVKPEMYEELYKIAEEEQADFIKADFYEFVVTKDGTIKSNYVKLTSEQKYYGRIINPEKEHEIFKFKINTWTGIYRRSFLEINDIKHNETPGAAYQDTGFWFQTFCCAKKVYFVNKAYYMYRRDNPDASTIFENPNWFPRIMAEYNFIYQWLKSNNLLERFKGPFAVKKFRGLKGGFDAAPDTKKREYCFIFAKEIAKHINNGEYDKNYFYDKDWKWMQLLLKNPEIFYKIRLQEAKIKKKMKNIGKRFKSMKERIT